MLSKISLASVVLFLGISLSTMGTIAYIADNATLNLGGFFYGFPLVLGGLAFKITELKPILPSQEISPEILALREAHATPTQLQIRRDINRYRYGQEAHLDEALAKVGLSPSDEERPLLIAFRETAIEEAYTLVLEFYSPGLGWDVWEKRREKIERFFGPGIKVTLEQPQDEKVDVFMVRNLEEEQESPEAA
jgi:hypothetical protein